jgi:hypothetical protein
MTAEARAETLRLLAHEGLPVERIADGFIEYWLAHGKTPEEIRSIALGERRTAVIVNGKGAR